METTAAFKLQDKVRANNVLPLPGNEVAPPLELDKEYLVFGICKDREGNQHLDVGLQSKFNYIRSHETDEHLPDGDTIHWCHPSRFVKV